MKIYRYSYYGTKLQKEEFEVEEKPKSYIHKGEYYESRFLKSEVGRVEHNDRSLILLTDDSKKAASLFAERKKYRLAILNAEVERIKSEIRYLEGVSNE